jgi:hypothetical protein
MAPSTIAYVIRTDVVGVKTVLRLFVLKDEFEPDSAEDILGLKESSNWIYAPSVGLLVAVR